MNSKINGANDDFRQLDTKIIGRLSSQQTGGGMGRIAGRVHFKKKHRKI